MGRVVKEGIFKEVTFDKNQVMGRSRYVKSCLPGKGNSQSMVLK